MMTTQLSIIICTYNRSRLLKKCLNSLLPQLSEEIEIIVIDNNSSDETADVTKVYITNYQNIRYLFEKNIGLSHARNRGINESKADWILYLDDDAIAFPDLVERALYLVNRGDFDCVGGMYYGYYEDIKPKWLPDHFESYHGSLTNLSECDFTIPIGCNVLYKKESVIKVGLFDINFGMKGNQMGYGEESELQHRLYNNGFKIGFDPLLKVYHIIRDDQLKLKWHLRSIYKKGYYGQKLGKNRYPLILCVAFMKTILGLIVRRFPINSYRWITKKNYYWQNMIYDSLMPNMLLLGRLIGSIKK